DAGRAGIDRLGRVGDHFQDAVGLDDGDAVAGCDPLDGGIEPLKRAALAKLGAGVVIDSSGHGSPLRSAALHRQDDTLHVPGLVGAGVVRLHADHASADTGLAVLGDAALAGDRAAERRAYRVVDRVVEVRGRLQDVIEVVGVPAYVLADVEVGGDDLAFDQVVDQPVWTQVDVGVDGGAIVVHRRGVHAPDESIAAAH